MAERVVSPRYKATDLAGVPLSGGMVWTYMAGTTSAVTTYSDPQGVTANTNPIILDTLGEALIFSDVPLKLVLQDPLGNTIRTDDNVESSGSSSGYFVTETGSGNSYVVALPAAVTGYTNGLAIRFIATHGNTGACTLNAGFGAVALVNKSGAAFSSGEIASGTLMDVVYSAGANKFYATDNSAAVAAHAALTVAHGATVAATPDRAVLRGPDGAIAASQGFFETNLTSGVGIRIASDPTDTGAIVQFTTNDGATQIGQIAINADGDMSLSSLSGAIYLNTKLLKAFVVDEWHSGTSWYRKWSDGWVEQGGWVETGLPTSAINFLVPMAVGWNAQITMDLDGSTTGGDVAGSKITSKSTTGMSVTTGWTNATSSNSVFFPFQWRAEGFAV